MILDELGIFKVVQKILDRHDMRHALRDAKHDMQWTLVRAAKKDQPGEERGTCRVCGYTGSREVEYTGKGIQLTEGMFKYIIIGIVAMIVILVVVKLISDAGRRNRRGHHGGYRGRH